MTGVITMPFSYTNRKKQVWRLFEGKTKLGKPRYFLSMADPFKNGKRLTAVPEGYEIYEKPSGQVFCRCAAALPNRTPVPSAACKSFQPSTQPAGTRTADREIPSLSLLPSSQP